jgi:hypothetical protein
MNYRLFNIDRMRGYSSLGFIRQCAPSSFDDSQRRATNSDDDQSGTNDSSEIDCSLLVTLLYEIINHLCKENNAAADYMVSSCMASLLAVLDPKFKWELS